MKHVVAAVVALACCAPGEAVAQLRQPRCGGWPSGEGNPGLIIGAAGTVCYGQLFPRFNPKLQLKDVRVIRPPAHASFRLLGLRDFEIVASPTLSGFDEMVLEMVWTRNGADETRRTRYRVTTDAEYQRAGGSAGNPPAGMTVTRRPGIGRPVNQ